MRRILCFGEALWDERPDGRVPGGAPMNVALRIVRLGGEVRLLSRVGNDPPGDELLAYLAGEGLPTATIQRDERQPTGRVVVDLSSPTEPRYDIVAPSAWDFIDFPPGADHASEPPAVVVFGSLAARHEVSRGSLLRVLEQATLRIFDVNLRPPFTDRATLEVLLQRADWIKLNEDELRTIAGWHAPASEPGEAMRSIADRYDLETVCVTLGGRGAAMLHAGRFYSQPGFEVPVVDTIGCGDSFLACWLTDLLNGRDPQSALRRACALGALVATRAGATAAIPGDELDALAGP